MRWIFWGFCRNRFLVSPLHYFSSRSDFGFEFAEIFVFEKRLPASLIRITDRFTALKCRVLQRHNRFIAITMMGLEKRQNRFIGRFVDEQNIGVPLTDSFSWIASTTADCNKKLNTLLLTVNYSKISLLVSNMLAMRFYGEQDGEQLWLRGEQLSVSVWCAMCEMSGVLSRCRPCVCLHLSWKHFIPCRHDFGADQWELRSSGRSRLSLQLNYIMCEPAQSADALQQVWLYVGDTSQQPSNIVFINYHHC